MPLTQVKGSVIDRGVYVTDYGAVGDGTTDDTAAIQAAINTGEAIVSLAGGTYRVDSTITIRSDLILEDGTLDFSNATTNDTCLSAFGSLATAKNLTVNATQGDTTLTVADSSSFAEHDWLLLDSNGVWDASDTASKRGEIVQVQSQSSGVITLRGDVMDSYTTADTAKVQEITLIQNVTLKDLTILGNDTDDNSLTGLNIAYGENINIDRCTFRKLSGSGVSFISCIAIRVSNCYFEDAFDAGSGYGVALSSAVQDVVVSGCSFVYCRHSVSHGVASGYVGIGRRLLITDNNVVNSAKATGGTGGDAIDTHSMSEDVHITNNTVTGSTGSGINFECKSGSISGNTIVGSTLNGIHYHNESDQPGSIIISQNRVLRTVGYYAIRCQHGSRGTTTPMRDVTISDNYIETTADYGIYVDGTSSYDAVQVIVKGNIFRGVATTPLYMQYISGAVVEGNISNAAVESFMDIRDTHAVSILNNWCRATPSGSYDMLFVQHAEDMQIHGNFLECTGGSGQSAQIYGTLDGVVITSNTMIHSNGSCLWFDPNTPTADKGCTIVGNRVVSATGTGILLSNEADYTAVVANHARGSSTPINMGTGSNNVNQDNIV